MVEPAEATGRLEVRVSGSGGQGIQLAAAVIAEAATAMGKQVVQTQSYGPAARGGASKAEVIISDDEIDFPEVRSPDVSLCLSRSAFAAFAANTRRGGVVVYDSGLIEPTGPLDGLRLHGLPFARSAAEHLAKQVVANVVAVGALVELADLLPAEAVEEAVARRVPERFRELNLEAFRLGRRLAAAGAR